MMHEDAGLSYADGKVKVELGDDPEREGIYEFTFDLYNTDTTEDRTYKLSAELFTQDILSAPATKSSEIMADYQKESTRFLDSYALFIDDAGITIRDNSITVPAGGSALLVYEARPNAFAPAGAAAAITNTATVTGGGLSAPLSDDATVTAAAEPYLTISKSLCPLTVTENGQLTYTFVVQNSGSAAAVATDNAVITDTFSPILSGLTVTFSGQVWTEGVDYTYDEATGQFATIPGRITVPAATFTQNESGVWVTEPGTAVLRVTGTV